MTISSPNGTPISPFCFGAMQFGGKADAVQSRAMYDACRAAGINFFDTAYVYTSGQSETLLGQFVAPEREDVIVATKVAYENGRSSRAALLEDFDICRGRLKLDHVDILYLHRWDPTVPLQETLDTLVEMQGDGLFTHIGVSNFAAWQVMKAACGLERLGSRLALIQPMYNLVKRQAEVEILPMAEAEGFAVCPYSPLGGGLLTGKYVDQNQGGRLSHDDRYAARYGQDWMHRTARDLRDLATETGVSQSTLAVAWAAQHPGVTAPIISASAPEQLAPSLAALDFSMDDALYARLSSLSPKPAPATDRTEEE